MGDYGRKLSNFNPDANFNLVRYGGDTPITEMELNETQMLLSHKVKALSQSVIGERFLEGGVISLNTDTNEFTITNQGLINEGRPLYITKLRGTLNNDETIYLDIYDKEVDKDSTIKLNGNLQETNTVPNTLLDPRLEGIETARRMQTCFDLVKATSRYEFTSNDPIINIGGVQNKSRLGVNSKILRLEGNAHQDPKTLAIEFVGSPQDDRYLVEIITTGENLFNINNEFEGCEYSIDHNSLEVYPRVANSWNGLTCKLNVKQYTDYTLQSEVEGKTMIHVLNENKEIIAIGNRTTFNTENNNVIYLVFHVGASKTIADGEKAIYRNISLTEGKVFRSYSNARQSVLGLSLPQPLAKIGNFADILYQNSSNEWVIEKHTQTTNFDGTEMINGRGWVLSQEGDNTNCFILENACPPSISNEIQETNLNNYALPKSYSQLWTSDVEGSAISVSGHLVVRLSKEQAPTLEVFKSLLKTNNMEVTHPIHEVEVIEDVEVLNRMSRMFKLFNDEVEDESMPSTFTYKGVGNAIRVNETRNGYTSNVHIEGHTTYSLPLELVDSPYQKFDAKTRTITNENKVEYREWEDVEVTYKMDKNTDYTISFIAKTDLICEIPCANVYPTLKAGEHFIHTFNSKDTTDFQFKIWSPLNEVAVIENMELFDGRFNTVPQIATFSNTQGLVLKSVGENEGEVDVQEIQYKYRGHFQPLTDLRSLPNGECDYIEQHEDGVYYFHKLTDSVTFTGRERMTVVEETEDRITVELVKALPKAINTRNGNTYCNTIQARESLNEGIKAISIVEGGKIRVAINTSELTTNDTTGVAKFLKDNETTLVYNVEEEVFECNMFDVKVFMGETVVTLEGGLIPSVFKCETRENEGVGVYTFNDNTNLMFTGVAPSQVTYVANFKPRLVEEEGHVYVPLATRVLGELKDLRIFDPHKVDLVNEDKDLTTGVYTTVKALRQNGTLKYKSILSEKDERGNYTRMTVRHYDVTGEVNFHTEKYAITYDLDGDIVSKELIKQW